jgi:two-component system sensor histidine kinase PilS (NtrC family)
VTAAAPRPPERRRNDRRRNDRRSGTHRDRRYEESWFGALGVEREADARDEAADSTPESRFPRGWTRQAEGPADSRFLFRQARRMSSPNAGAFLRIYRMFVGARAALGVALLAALVTSDLFGLQPPLVPMLVSGCYAIQAVVLWWLPRWGQGEEEGEPTRLTRTQWLLTIGVDLLAFSALHQFAPVSSFNYAALLVLPVLMAGVLTPRPVALATAAGVTLMLLAAATRGGLDSTGVASAMSQAGLTGLGFFVITLLAGELAGRLAREELTARGSLELARQQAQLNRLVIDEMGEGVLVIDRRERVRTANPAARRLLAPNGSTPPAPFPLHGMPAWKALVDAVDRAFREAAWPEAGRDVTLQFDEGSSRTLRVRVRFTRRRPLDTDDEDGAPAATEEFCVLFIEDMKTVQARTRQEKLAAMGRVSAGIAHEIRNPLAAIAQANALMQEDALAPAQQRLARMVADNVARLKRIVDDVMEVAPGTPPVVSVIDAHAEVAACTSEWARTVQLRLGEASRLRVSLPDAPLGVMFDVDHLHRVLVNLLENARRHASEQSGAIELCLTQAGPAQALLSVASDGPPIAADVERHLFEPFFSTRSRGTGLGLYICKELCERYGASIEYRVRPADQLRRNEFLVTMRQGTLMQTEARLHL